MRYLVQVLTPIHSFTQGTRPGFNADGVESMQVPCIAIGPVVLPADTNPADSEVASHVGAIIARDISKHLLSAAKTMRAIDLPDGAPAPEQVADALRAARIGDPASSALYILIPQDTDRTIIYTARNVVPAMYSERLAGKRPAIEASAQAIDKARQAYMDCVQRATRDSNVMMHLFTPSSLPGAIADAFSVADYVKQAKQAIYGGNVCA